MERLGVKSVALRGIFSAGERDNKLNGEKLS